MQTQQKSPGEILPRGDTSGALAIPVELIPKIYVESAERGIAKATSMAVDSPESYAAMGEIVNGLQKLGSTGEEHVLGAGKPFRNQAAAIRERGKVILSRWSEAKEAGLAKMRTWKALDDAKREAAIKAQQEAQLREEAARREEEAKRRLIEAEAAAREELAARKMEAAKTPAQLQKAITAGEEAQAIRSQAVEMEAAESLVPFVPTAVDISAKVKAKGIAERPVVTFLKYDVSKLDAAFLLCDEKKLKRAILDGFVKAGSVPGLVFTVGTDIGATGR